MNKLMRLTLGGSAGIALVLLLAGIAPGKIHTGFLAVWVLAWAVTPRYWWD